jgi:hypothetical protein
MQPDPKHQQDHTQLGELGSQSGVGDEARRGGADQNARGEVADKRWKTQTIRAIPKDCGEYEGKRDRRYQCDFVMHVFPRPPTLPELR